MKTKPNNEWETRILDTLIDLGTDWTGSAEITSDEALVRIVKIVKSLLQQQRDIDFDESILNAEKEADIAKKAYSDGYNDCKKGRKKSPHDTRLGYCCACDYDLACFEEKLQQQREEIDKSIKEAIDETWIKKERTQKETMWNGALAEFETRLKIKERRVR